MIDIDVNPFPCGITDAELDPPDIYGCEGEDKFLTLPEGDGQDSDDDFDIDDMPLGDDGDEQLVLDPGEDFEIDSMPLGDEDGEEQAPAIQDTVPAEEPPEEPAPGVQDTAPAEEPRQPEPAPAEPAQESPAEEAPAIQDTAPAEEPAQETQAEAPAEEAQEPAPAQGPREPAVPWLEKTQARVRAIGRVRACAEEVARAEITEIAQALEGGGGDERFAEYAKRLRAGDFADMGAAKRALNFYFSMRFATLNGLYDWAWLYDGGLEAYLWACYGDYIPADCWHAYADTLRQDPDREAAPLHLFHMMWRTYAKIRAADIATRERDWERAAKAAGEARADVHGKCADRRSKEDFDRAHALREAEDQALTRTAYWWQYSLRASVKAAMTGKKPDVEYERTCAEFNKKLGGYL